MANRFLPAGLTIPNYNINPLQYAKAGQNWIAKQWDDVLSQGELQAQRYKQGLERKIADANAIKQQLEQDAIKKANEIKSQAKKELDTLFGKQTSGYSKGPQVKGPINATPQVNQFKYNQLSPAGKVVANIKNASVPNVAKGIGGKVAPYAVPIIDAVTSGMNWNLPGSDWRTRTLDLIGAVGNAGATGLGIAGGTALGHPVVGGLIGGGIGAGISSRDKLKAQQLRQENWTMDDWKNYYDKDAEDKIRKAFPDDKELQQYYIDRYYGRGIGQQQKQEQVADDLPPGLLAQALDPNSGMTVFGDRIEDLQNIGKLFDLDPTPNISALPPVPNVTPSPSNASLTQGGVNISPNQLTDVNGDASGLDLNTLIMLSQLFGNNTNSQSQPQQAPVPANELALRPKEEIEQPLYSPQEQALIDQLNAINKQILNTQQAKRDPYREAYFASALGLSPSSVFGTPQTEVDRLKALQTSLANQLKLQSAIEEEAQNRRARQALTGAVTGGSANIEGLLPYLLQNDKTASSAVQYLMAPYFTEPLTQAKDQRALQKDILGRLISNQGQLGVAQLYGENAINLANLKFPQEVYKTNVQGRNTAINTYLNNLMTNQRANAKTIYDAGKTEYIQQQKNNILQQANSALKAYEATGKQEYLTMYNQLMGISSLIDVTGGDILDNTNGGRQYSRNVIDAYED